MNKNLLLLLLLMAGPLVGSENDGVPLLTSFTCNDSAEKTLELQSLPKDLQQTQRLSVHDPELPYKMAAAYIEQQLSPVQSEYEKEFALLQKKHDARVRREDRCSCSCVSRLAITAGSLLAGVGMGFGISALAVHCANKQGK